jgi:nucleoside-diphosphate-sugar epimerase
MKIIVTGAAGAIGSHLCERLLDLGHEVIGIDALTPYYSPEIKKINAADVEMRGGEMHFLDLISDDFGHLLDGADIIFHMAAQPGLSFSTPFEDYLNNNIIATHNILKKAKTISTLKGFIHASTSSVYGTHANGPEISEPKPISYYGVTKLAAEQLAMSYFRESGLPVTVLRLFSVYGERERPEKLYHKLIKAMHENKEFPLYENAKEHIRSYTYIKDIIDGCILVLQNMDKAIGEIFNLGNNKTMTTGEGINILEKVMNKPAKFIILPKRVGDQKETSADITKMRKFFDYNPRASLEEGLANQVKWYSDKIHGKII